MTRTGRTLAASAAIVACGLALAWAVPSPAAEDKPAAGAVARTSSATDRLKAAEVFREAKAKADKVQSGPEGLAIWEEFVRNNTEPAFVPIAQKELDAWKDRADKGQVRWGPGWEKADEVARKNAQADEFLQKAEAAADLDEAVKLYAGAAAAHPFRAEIPLRKGIRYYKAGKLKEAGLAWGEVIKPTLDPDCAAARNNLGVLAATSAQKNWAAAVQNLSRAAVVSDDDRMWDNLDAAAAAAQESRSAMVLGSPESYVYGIVKQVRQVAGKHKDQARWGNRWISDAEYQKMTNANNEIDRKIASNAAQVTTATNTRLATLKRQENDARRQVELLQGGAAATPGSGRTTVAPATARTAAQQQVRQQLLNAANKKLDAILAAIQAVEDEIAKLKAENEALAGKKYRSTHVDRYILLDADGQSELGSVEVVTDAKTDVLDVGRFAPAARPAVAPAAPAGEKPAATAPPPKTGTGFFD